jgi:hypothetical protein
MVKHVGWREFDPVGCRRACSSFFLSVVLFVEGVGLWIESRMDIGARRGFSKLHWNRFGPGVGWKVALSGPSGFISDGFGVILLAAV